MIFLNFFKLLGQTTGWAMLVRAGNDCHGMSNVKCYPSSSNNGFYICPYFLTFIKMLVSAENVHWDIVSKIHWGKKVINRNAAGIFSSCAWVGWKLDNLESCIMCFSTYGSHTNWLMCQIALQWPGIVVLTAQIGTDSSQACQKLFS